jgi:hypothetical protein
MPDDADLIKAGAQGIVEGALAPFADLLRKLAEPGVQELGLTIQDSVRVFRMKRQVRLLERVREMLNDVDAEPNRVPLKMLTPVIEGASLEEDNELQDRWAALLANVAISGDSRVAYAEALRQLSRPEVLLLRMAFYYALPQGTHKFGVNNNSLRGVIRKWKQLLSTEEGLSESDPESIRAWLAALESAARLGLIKGDGEDYTLTDFGFRLAGRCEEPATIRMAHRKLAEFGPEMEPEAFLAVMGVLSRGGTWPSRSNTE